MNRYDINLGKRVPEKDSSGESQSTGIKSAQVSGGKNLLIRGPGGYASIVPVRFIDVEVRQGSPGRIGSRCDLILTMPAREARNIAQDIESGKNRG